jgi:nucleoside-diphosphate-sugar epimerase
MRSRSIPACKEHAMIQSPNPGKPMVLVTGATGFTGSHLVRSLVRDGYRVRVLARSAPRASAQLPAGIEVVTSDANDRAAAGRATTGVELVYHLAAAYREAKHTDQYYWDVNVGFTSLLLDAARAAGVQRFVHCSTVGVMSHIEHPPADEQHPHQPGDIYQYTKSEAEKLALVTHGQHGLPVAVARPTAIYGPGDTRLLKMFRLIAERRFIMLGSGEIYYHMVHVDDLVRGLRLLGEHPASVGEVFILGGERYYKLRAIVELIARAAGVPPPRWRLPAWPFQTAGTICEKICIPLGIEPPIYRRRVDFFTKSRAFTIQKARRLLGYKPTIDLEVGIPATVEWYRVHGHLPRVVSSGGVLDPELEKKS